MWLIPIIIIVITIALAILLILTAPLWARMFNAIASLGKKQIKEAGETLEADEKKEEGNEPLS